jgi:transposase
MGLPFEQQTKESDKAFAAFALYLSMGSERSTAAVATKLTKSEQLVRRWSARWRWTERVSAHAAHLAAVERDATEALARGKSAEWLKRQQELREREWTMHEKCIAAAERGLKAFMEREKVYANLADIARMLEVASKLGRLASGLATDKTEVTGEDGGPIRVELAAALNKIYGEVVDVETTPVPPAQLMEAGK